MHFDNIQMIKEAVALGQGISILPARTMQAEIEQGRLVAVKLNAPGLARPLGIVHRRKKKFNRATEALLGMLLASVGQVVNLRPIANRPLTSSSADKSSRYKS